MQLEKICNWIKEINDGKPKSFSDYFIDDIVRYLGLYNDKCDESSLRFLCGNKFNALKNCSTKKEVGTWLKDIISFVIMKVDIESIIADYLNDED